MRFLGKINIDLYNFIPFEIRYPDVVITKRQFQHIAEKHTDVLTHFDKYFPDLLENPDYIIEADKPKTAILLYKEPFSDKTAKVVLRLATTDDSPEYINSIITFMRIVEKEPARILRNKKIVYIKT